MQLSIIIPILNEASIINDALKILRERIMSAGRIEDVEIIVVDGGSTDQSVQIAKNYADHAIISAPGRARQMNAGASVATGHYLLFLHIDTLPSEDFFQAMPLSDQQAVWGFFTVKLSGTDWIVSVSAVSS